jgi:hypothetical protein
MLQAETGTTYTTETSESVAVHEVDYTCFTVIGPATATWPTHFYYYSMTPGRFLAA